MESLTNSTGKKGDIVIQELRGHGPTVDFSRRLNRVGLDLQELPSAAGTTAGTTALALGQVLAERRQLVRWFQSFLSDLSVLEGAVGWLHSR